MSRAIHQSCTSGILVVSGPYFGILFRFYLIQSMYDLLMSLVVVFLWLCSYVHCLHIFYRSVPQPVVLTSLNGRPTPMFGPVCSFCHTGAGMLIWSYILLSFIALKYMLVCPHAHIPHFHYTTLLFHLFTLIYWLVCTSAHLFYSHLWASMPLLSFIGWYPRLLILFYSHLWASMPLLSFIDWYTRLPIYSTHSYGPVCPYSHLLAGMHVCSFFYS